MCIRDRAYTMSKKMIKIGLVIGIVMGAGVIAAGEPLLSLFSFSRQGEEYAFRILIIYGLTMWLTIYNATHVTGTLRCGGDTKFAMVTETATVWLIGVPPVSYTHLLYPVLRRLQKEGLCRTYDMPYQGRNRRYYSITEEGRSKLEEYRTQWLDYKHAIDTVSYTHLDVYKRQG